MNSSDVIQEACDALQSLLRAIDRNERDWDVMNYNDGPPSSPDSSTPIIEKYKAYFQVLIDVMWEEHNFTGTRRAPDGRNFHPFPSGTTGIKYVARFTDVETVQTYLLIRFGDKQTTKNFFDVLRERESEINARFDVPLCWSRRDDIKTSRIYIEREGTIESHESELEAFRAWHVENLLKFKSVFTPEIQRALEKLRSSEIEPEEERRC